MVTSLDILPQKYTEIEQIITTWPELSEHNKKAILDIIRASYYKGIMHPNVVT